MPRQDGTGPQGMGALTGRGLGPCRNGMRRECYGRGFGKGFGFRAKYSTPITLTNDEEKKILEEELEEINLEKQEIEQKLKELK